MIVFGSPLLVAIVCLIWFVQSLDDPEARRLLKEDRRKRRATRTPEDLKASEKFQTRLCVAVGVIGTVVYALVSASGSYTPSNSPKHAPLPSPIERSQG